MPLACHTFVHDKKLGAVPESHGFDSFTRLQMRVGRLNEVARFRLANQCLYWDVDNQDFEWKFIVERAPGIPWEKTSPAVMAAMKDFFDKCTPKASAC